ncbi:MAG: undecaprenyldiphospho-muramoylpentapeptide beta-N-acetylglucosaminyltransferase [Bacteroidaceae bacterium]|nr:undecaprenyldiphospho-muramoylpentapeptide beta-N-acetylglucosaminyltransferase [Bacteroidaceae bacterium]
MEPMRVIISGGGTGGHIFPALSIANALKEKRPDTEILFVGAENRMEMQRVPAAGYPIKGLPVSGFDRKHLLKNIVVLWRLAKSQRMAKKIVRSFKPDVAVGVGGYASGPTLKMAAAQGIPTLLQEQNSYAGVTNKLLAKSASVICVAYEGLERFFPAEKIKLTGNPVRQSLLEHSTTHEKAAALYGFDPQKPIVLIVGGSLGARSINEAILAHLDEIRQGEVQFIWQTGKYYFEEMRKRVGDIPKNLFITDFIGNMDDAYTAADLIISRAGAGSISEFCLLGKAVILVPSPNVAEDHQTKNAMALVNKGAGVYVSDKDAQEKLVATAFELVHDEEKLAELRKNILTMALPDSASIIADEVFRLAEEHRNMKKESRDM